MSGKHWTAKEITFLKVNYGNVSPHKISNLFNRSKGAITTKAYRLGLSAYPNKVKCECVVCGNSYEIQPYRLREGRNTYCSRECYNQTLIKRFTGKNNPNWNGGVSFEPYCNKFNHELKERIRNKQNRSCFLCGKSEIQNERRLSIHHIDNDKTQGCNGSKWKLVALCMSCHLGVHRNLQTEFNLLSNLRLEAHLREPVSIGVE